MGLGQMEKTKRIMWMSDSPTVHTGYGTVTRQVTKRLAKKPNYDVTCIGWQTHGMPMRYNFDKSRTKIDEVHDTNLVRCVTSGTEPFGRQLLQTHLKNYKPHIFTVLCDSFMVGYLANQSLAPAKFAMYFPSDGVPLPMGSELVFKKADYLIAMAKFGKKQAEDAGYSDVRYIPHGYDKNLYFQLSEERKKTIKRAYGLNNTFVFGYVGRNQGRKNYPHLFRSFAKFVKDKQNCILWLHCDPMDSAGSNLYNLVKKYHLEGLVRFTPNIRWFDNLPEESMKNIYNLFDVHVSATTGEGFGIPTIEAMACGTPNIITNFTTSKELVEGHGWLVDVRDTIDGTYEVERAFVDTDHMVEQMNEAYYNHKLREEYSKKGLDFVKQFEWDKVYPLWEKFYEEALE